MRCCVAKTPGGVNVVNDLLFTKILVQLIEQQKWSWRGPDPRPKATLLLSPRVARVHLGNGSRHAHGAWGDSSSQALLVLDVGLGNPGGCPGFGNWRGERQAPPWSYLPPGLPAKCSWITQPSGKAQSSSRSLRAGSLKVTSEPSRPLRKLIVFPCLHCKDLINSQRMNQEKLMGLIIINKMPTWSIKQNKSKQTQ